MTDYHVQGNIGKVHADRDFKSAWMGKLLVLLMRERDWVCWAQFGCKEKEQLSVANVYLRGENGTAEWECSARIKDNTAGTWVREQGRRYRYGCHLYRHYPWSRDNICCKRESPEPRLNFHKCSVSQLEHRKKKSQGWRQRSSKEIEWVTLEMYRRYFKVLRQVINVFLSFFLKKCVN